MKVVIDTDVFVSSFSGGKPKKIIDLWKTDKITLCLSAGIFDEYIDVLRRIGLDDEAELDELLTLFLKGFNILFTRKTPRLKVIKNDPDDDKFIECAIALKASVVVSGDTEVLAMKEYMGIKIFSPSDFLESYASLE
jgi:putative PIN family toxin of toxin-antitoxin system